MEAAHPPSLRSTAPQDQPTPPSPPTSRSLTKRLSGAWTKANGSSEPAPKPTGTSPKGRFVPNQFKDDTELHKAARKGDRQVIGVLIACGVDLDPQNAQGMTPLHEAVSYGQFAPVELLVKQLVANKLSLDVPDHMGRTPLHTAACTGKDALISLLLEHGADRSVRDKEGNTPWDLWDARFQRFFASDPDDMEAKERRTNVHNLLDPTQRS